LVILGFIEPIRTEYWNDTFKGGKWLGWNVGQDYIQHDLLDIVGDKEWWEKYVTFFLNKTTLNYTLKNQILLLTSFFESNNIKYLMFFSWGHHLKNYKDFKTINKKYFLPEEFQNFIREELGRKRALTKCDHASVEGHKIWTEKLCKELKDRKVT